MGRYEFTPPDEDTIIEMQSLKNNGQTYKQIAEQFEMSTASASKYIGQAQKNKIVEKRNDAVEIGLRCERCTICFERSHGVKVLCASCIRALEFQHKKIEYPKAWIPEIYVRLKESKFRGNYRRKAK